mgnify:FL=1|jgi:NhaP-type Na+/H+ and K+/H+ antiporter
MSTLLGTYLLVIGFLLIISVYLDRVGNRLRLPGVLLVLLLGLLTHNEVHVGGQTPPLLSLAQASDLAQVAVGVVLFQAGISTNWQQMRSVARPGLRLALLGSTLTALLLMLVLQKLPFEFFSISQPSWAMTLFVGAMVCSTDASAVISVLRPQAGQFPQRLLDLLEFESSVNDPIAVVLASVGLTIGMTALQSTAAIDPTAQLMGEGPLIANAVLRQLLIGALIGFMVGSLVARLLENKTEVIEAGHRERRAVLILAMLLVVLGITSLGGGSPLLAAYITGLLIGNGDEDSAIEVEKSIGSYGKLAELVLFLSMGLVVDPLQVLVLLPWILLLAVLMLLVRFVVVFLLLGSSFTTAQKQFVGFCGLRGAVPIALAIHAAAHPQIGQAWGQWMPPIALGVVLLGLLLQGLTLMPLARRLGLVEQG